MNHNNGRYYGAALLVFIAAFGVVVFQKERSLKRTVTEHAQIAALLTATERQGVTIDTPQKSVSCVLQDGGSLPDYGCTPGAVFPDATADIICKPGYSKSVRNVSVGLKQEMYAAYGIVYPQLRGSYELDHQVPLELGGSNNKSNLWPEAAQPTGTTTLGFHEKDVVENYLHEQVCNGVIDLAAAQKQIATDWIAVYVALSPETIARLTQEFPSWATPN